MSSSDTGDCEKSTDEVICGIQSKLTLIQVSPSSFSAPTDVTLKLSDGSIDAHRMILSAVSPVFERMLYGDFKEGKSNEVKLPSDTHSVMKLLVDFVYNGKCKVKGLDDMFPLLEVLDRYQINKVPYHHMIGEAVLANLDSSNYLTLLPKFASVMGEDANRKAAEQVMIYTNNKVIEDSTSVQLPEEVLLPLLQSLPLNCYDIEIFNFLVKWHEYQTSLGKTLHLTSQLFRCIRYSLIIPQLLLSKVAFCDLADKQLVSEAYHYLNCSCSPLGEYSKDDHCKSSSVQLSRKPRTSFRLDWAASSDITVKYSHVTQCNITGTGSSLSPYEHLVKSQPLSDGIYSFTCNSSTFSVPRNYQVATWTNYDSLPKPFSLCFSVSDSSTPNTPIYTNHLQINDLVTLYIYGNNVFVKTIAQRRVTPSASITERGPYCVCIFKSQVLGNACTFSFDLSNVECN